MSADAKIHGINAVFVLVSWNKFAMIAEREPSKSLILSPR